MYYVKTGLLRRLMKSTTTDGAKQKDRNDLQDVSKITYIDLPAGRQVFATPSSRCSRHVHISALYPSEQLQVNILR